MTTPPSVTVIGDALIDELRDETGTRSFPGGAALNVAVGLRVLGIPTALVAMVGDDADGDTIREYLAAFDVDLRATVPPGGSSRATSDRTDGEPQYHFNAAAKNRHIDFDRLQAEAIDAATLVVVSCFPFDSNDQTRDLERLIRDPADRLIIDPNPRAGMLADRAAFVTNFERLSARALLTKVGDDDAGLLYDTDLETLTERLHRQNHGAILGTAGSHGASVIDASGTSAAAPIATLPGPIVDTMGAGDAVLSSVTYSLLGGGVPETAVSWFETLETAMLIAAATCREEGALLRIPRDAQLLLPAIPGLPTD